MNVKVQWTFLIIATTIAKSSFSPTSRHPNREREIISPKRNYLFPSFFLTCPYHNIPNAPATISQVFSRYTSGKYYQNAMI